MKNQLIRELREAQKIIDTIIEENFREIKRRFNRYQELNNNEEWNWAKSKWGRSDLMLVPDPNEPYLTVSYNDDHYDDSYQAWMPLTMLQDDIYEAFVTKREAEIAEKARLEAERFAKHDAKIAEIERKYALLEKYMAEIGLTQDEIEMLW